VRIIAEDLIMHRKPVRQIITEDLGMRKLSAKMTRYNVSFLAQEIHYKIDRPPDSPDFPCELWFFPKSKNALKEQRFADIPDIQSNVNTLPRVIPENDFQDYFQQRHHRVTKGTASQGDYFEGDSSR
jgi:hypothetical protein